MNVMRFALVIGCVTLLTVASSGQYWIGPKVGYHYTLHDYQDDDYRDSYKINGDHNFEAGLVVTYAASERYAVHGELLFEQIANRVRNKSDFIVDSETRYNFISAPILLRVSMGHSPVHWYLNAGPKVSFWLGGNGNITYEDDEGNFEGFEIIDYKVAFNKKNASKGTAFLVNDPNRLQYALTAGGGFYLDLANGARVMVDFRYNWGHSNMGFNVDVNEAGQTLLVGSTSPEIPENGYQENYEYTHNTLSLSIAYMFEYNTDLKRKGGSTIRASRNTKKSTKAKKKSSQ